MKNDVLMYHNMRTETLYFNGFELHQEHILWQSLPTLQWHSKHDVIGFNTGAIDAINHSIHATKKIRRLSLISPLLFHHFDAPQHSPSAFKYPRHYVNDFWMTLTKNDHDPSVSQEHLRAFYKYSPNLSFEQLIKAFQIIKKEDLISLKNQGVEIEIYLGEYDPIIDITKALDFFLPCSHRVFLIKRQGHFLGTLSNKLLIQ